MDIKNILHACVDEMYNMEKGAFIARPDEALHVGDGLLTRRQIKHIIEQRKAERKSAEDVKQILAWVPEVITAFDFEMTNWNQSYQGSIVRAKIFHEHDRGLVVVMDKKEYDKRGVITAHEYSPKHLHLLQKKKLDTTAAGKTPHS